jgi:hypothetical protein
MVHHVFVIEMPSFGHHVATIGALGGEVEQAITPNAR